MRLILLFNFLYDKLQRTNLQKYRSQLYWTAVVLALVVISGVRLGNWELAPSTRYYSRTVISLLLPVFSLLPLLDWRRRIPADWKNGLWRRLQTAPFDLWRKRLVAIMVPVAIIQAVSAARMSVEFDKFTKYLAALSQLKAGTLSYEEAAAQSGLPASPTFKLFNGSWPLIYASMLSD
jgi:hypothetical protein